MKPKIRKEASLEFHYKIVQSAYETLEKNADKFFPFQSCINCTYWSTSGNEICEKFKARPPANVIVFGCDEYSDQMDVPF